MPYSSSRELATSSGQLQDAPFRVVGHHIQQAVGSLARVANTLARLPVRQQTLLADHPLAVDRQSHKVGPLNI
jgi:hypothetical protein